MKRKKQRTISEELKTVLQQSQFYVYTAIAIFAGTILFGVLFPYFFEAQIFAMLEKMIEELAGKDAFSLSFFIFRNNVSASAMALLFGMFVGVVPILISIMNGYVIGFTSHLAVSQAGVFVLWRLVPHGIFELPAVILSVGLGIFLGARFLEERFNVHNKYHQIAILISISIVFGAIMIILFPSIESLSALDSYETIIASNQVPTLLVLFILELSTFFFSLFVLYTFITKKQLLYDFARTLLFFILIIIPLLLVAGFIEGFLVYFIS